MTAHFPTTRPFTLPENSDLVWELNDFDASCLAERFMKLFENRLGVYSESVRALYTNYNLFFPVQEGRKMVILPNPYAYHDTLHRVDPEAIAPTGISIFPGLHAGAPTLLLLCPATGRLPAPRPLPLKAALARMILRELHYPGEFLPVLVKGDLRRFDRLTPCLHLHRLRPADLTRLSEFERMDIRGALIRKLMGLYKDSDKLLLA